MRTLEEMRETMRHSSFLSWRRLLRDNDILLYALEIAALQLQDAQLGCLPSDKSNCQHWQKMEHYSEGEPCSTCDAYASTQSEWLDYAIAQAQGDER